MDELGLGCIVLPGLDSKTLFQGDREVAIVVRLEAAKALTVSPRTVRRLIDRGELEGRKVREHSGGEAWEVSVDSLYAPRDKRG